MTSSPISRFKFARRRLLFLSAQKAAVYHWEKGVFGPSFLFDVNQEGRGNFERYLRETPNTTMSVMVDVFEEEFRRDTIPHVFGADREAILDRKTSRMFRDTPFHYTRVFGREESGRRDDRILLTALNNPGLVEPWLTLLDRHKVPMAGLHSLPLFKESLLGDIPDASDYMLLVSLQSISGLRQTFFQNKEFRISRLVQMPRYGTTSYAPHIKEEIEKIHRYLSSLRLTSLNQPLDIYFLLTGGLLDDLKAQYENTSNIKYHFLDINELAAKAGSTIHVNAPFSDQYFAYQFLKKHPANIYATPTNRRYASMRRLRLSMLAASIVLFMSAVIWGGINFVGGLTLKQNSIAAENKARFYQTRYEIARSRLPPTPVEPADLKIAVELVETLYKYKSTPAEMVKVLSRGFNRFPTIILDKFEWSSSLDPNIEVGNAPAGSNTQGVVGFSPVSNTETGYDLYQIAMINGHLSPFDGDYRKAIDTINRFAEYLGTGESVYNVSVISMPLDTSSTANLQGNSQNENRDANFSIRVTLGVKNDS